MSKGGLLLALAVALAVLSGLVHAADVDMVLKCKAIELYLNNTGVAASLSCDQLLKEGRVANSTNVVLPMIGVGELKKGGVAGSRAIFDRLREARMSALANLTGHVERVRRIVLGELNVTGLDRAYTATDRVVRELYGLKSFLERAGASPVAVVVIVKDIQWINATRTVLWTVKQGDAWAIKAVGNASDVEMSRALRRFAELKALWNNVSSQLKELRIAWYSQAKDAVERWLRSANSTLIDIWIATRVNRDATVRYLKAGNLDAIRDIANKAKKEAPELARKIAEIARELTSDRNAGQTKP